MQWNPKLDEKIFSPHNNYHNYDILLGSGDLPQQSPKKPNMHVSLSTFQPFCFVIISGELWNVRYTQFLYHVLGDNVSLRTSASIMTMEIFLNGNQSLILWNSSTPLCKICARTHVWFKKLKNRCVIPFRTCISLNNYPLLLSFYQSFITFVKKEQGIHFSLWSYCNSNFDPLERRKREKTFEIHRLVSKINGSKAKRELENAEQARFYN